MEDDPMTGDESRNLANQHKNQYAKQVQQSYEAYSPEQRLNVRKWLENFDAILQAGVIFGLNLKADHFGCIGCSWDLRELLSAIRTWEAGHKYAIPVGLYPRGGHQLT